MTRRWVIRNLTAAVVLASVGMTGCVGWQPLDTGTQSVTGASSPSGVLNIETSNGTVEVRRAEVSSIEVDATIRAAGKERLERTRVVVEPGNDGGARVFVQWPDGGRIGNEGCSLMVRTPGAGGVDVRTSNGRVVASGLSGPASIRTSNATVQVGPHIGPVRVDTSNGRIDAEHITGDVVLNSSNGRIETVDVGGAVRADTSNGSIVVRLSASGNGPVDLSTSNGSVRVEVGPAFAGVVDASTSNGAVTINGATDVSGSRTHVRGQYGAGECKSVVRTSNGSVEVVRAGG
jgi:DUF4097 and DUF4098 domain-containing protein YvlB